MTVQNEAPYLPGPCFGGDAESGPNSNNTCEPLGAGGADMAEYPDSLD